MNLLLLKIYQEKSKFICIWLSRVIFAVLFFPIAISASDSEHVVISPMSVLGEIPVPEQQMLFNRFRERINQHYSLVSYQVLEMIAEQEKNIDIENCKSSDCAQKVNLEFDHTVKVIVHTIERMLPEIKENSLSNLKKR